MVPAAPGSLADRNLLFVTFDTTRADRIGCYGNNQIRTYTLDRLAAEGVLFSQAIAPAPTTLPSHASMLTGLYPYHHGARANGLYRLDSKYLTLAEILTDNGYATGAAVSASVLEKQYGIAQGFQDYDDETESKDETGGLAAVTVAERTGDQTVERAEQWIRAHAADKFFYWVHFYDPHFPYQAPSPYSEKYADPYDAEIAFTDAQLARLVELLDELDLSDRTLIVIAGDHGEARGQHEEPTHACLVYDSTLHVPMVMRCGDQLGGGVHVQRPVSLVDIMPTVLTLLGIEAPAPMDGIDLTQPPAGDRSLYFETLQGLADYGWAALLGVRNESWKYIHGPTSELYDVSTDPFEATDLIDARPEIAAAMHQRLEDFFGTDLEQAASAEPTHRLDAAELAKLQSLGYLQDVGGETPPPSERRHPKEIIALLSTLR